MNVNTYHSETVIKGQRLFIIKGIAPIALRSISCLLVQEWNDVVKHELFFNTSSDAVSFGKSDATP